MSGKRKAAEGVEEEGESKRARVELSSSQTDAGIGAQNSLDVDTLGISDSAREWLREEPDEEERKRLAAILASFSEEQMDRYETFRRSQFSKPKVKKLIQHVTGGKGGVSDEVVIALSGVSKIFAGELIEMAKEDMNDFKGPIHPLHIRNAYRKLKMNGRIPYLRSATKEMLD